MVHADKTMYDALSPSLILTPTLTLTLNQTPILILTLILTLPQPRPRPGPYNFCVPPLTNPPLLLPSKGWTKSTLALTMGLTEHMQKHIRYRWLPALLRALVLYFAVHCAAGYLFWIMARMPCT